VTVQIVKAFVLIGVGSNKALNFVKTVGEKIGRIKGIKEIRGVFGRYDFVVRVETKTLEDWSTLVTDKIRG